MAKINPDVLQLYLLSIAKELRSDASIRNKAVTSLIHKDYSVGTQDAVAETICLKEVDTFLKNFTFKDTDIQLIEPIVNTTSANSATDNNKIKSIDNLDIKLIIKKVDPTLPTPIIREEVSLTNNNSFLNPEYFPFEIKNVQIQNLSKDIYTTKISQQGSFNISFKNFNSLTEKIKVTTINNTVAGNIEFSLLNLISYSYRENGNISFELKFIYKNGTDTLEKVLAITPIKHEYSFYKNKPNNGTLNTPGILYHDVTVNFVSSENTNGHNINTNLFAQFEAKTNDGSLVEQRDNSKLVELTKLCNDLELARTQFEKETNPAQKAANQATLISLKDNLKNQINSLGDNLGVVGQTLQDELDRYLIDKFFKGSPESPSLETLRVKVLNETINIFEIQKSIADKFLSVEGFGSAASFLTGVSGIVAFGLAATAVPLSAIALPIVFAVTGLLGIISIYKSKQATTTQGNTDLKSTPPNTINVVRALYGNSLNSAKEEAKTPDTNGRSKAERILDLLGRANTPNVATPQDTEKTRNVDFIYLADIIRICREQLLNPASVADEEYIIGNMVMYDVNTNSSKVEPYILNIGHLPVSVPIFIKYLQTVNLASGYSVNFDKFIIDFLQDYMKKYVLQYFVNIKRYDSSFSIPTNPFSPVINSNYLFVSNSNEISAALKNIGTTADNTKNISLSKYPDLIKNLNIYSDSIRSISAGNTTSADKLLKKITYLGSNVQFKNLDLFKGFSGGIYDGPEICKHIITNFNIPSIMFGNERLQNYNQILSTSTVGDGTFKKIDDSTLMNAAIYSGASLINMPYSGDLKLIPAMYMYLFNGNYIFIASPIRNLKSSLFSGLYVITNSTFSYDFSKSRSKIAEIKNQNANYSVSISNAWFGTDSSTFSNSSTLSVQEAVCNDFNQFEITTDGSKGSTIRLRR